MLLSVFLLHLLSCVIFTSISEIKLRGSTLGRITEYNEKNLGQMSSLYTMSNSNYACSQSLPSWRNKIGHAFLQDDMFTSGR